jgi:hypothetical protein
VELVIDEMKSLFGVVFDGTRWLLQHEGVLLV